MEKQKTIDQAAKNPTTEWSKSQNEKTTTENRQNDAQAIDYDLPDTFDLNSVKRQDADKCALCPATFSVFGTKRHHCRKCGRSVCDPCSTAKRKLSNADPTCYRMCDACDNKIMNKKTTDIFKNLIASQETNIEILQSKLEKFEGCVNSQTEEGRSLVRKLEDKEVELEQKKNDIQSYVSEKDKELERLRANRDNLGKLFGSYESSVRDKNDKLLYLQKENDSLKIAFQSQKGKCELLTRQLEVAYEELEKKKRNQNSHAPEHFFQKSQDSSLSNQRKQGFSPNRIRRQGQAQSQNPTANSAMQQFLQSQMIKEPDTKNSSIVSSDSTESFPKKTSKHQVEKASSFREVPKTQHPKQGRKPAGSAKRGARPLLMSNEESLDAISRSTISENQSKDKCCIF